MNETPALIIDEHCLQTLCRATFEQDWFKDFYLNDPKSGVFSCIHPAGTYLLSSKANEGSRLVIIDLTTCPLRFADEDAQEPFGRILTIGLNQFEQTVTIPRSWQPYREGSRVSIFANARSSGGTRRLYMDRRPASVDNLFVYASTLGPTQISSTTANLSLFHRARNGLVDALIERESQPKNGNQPQQEMHGVVILDQLPEGFTHGWTLDDWYQTHLTTKQRAFVDKPYDSPVRLRGAAGTGKTVSLIIKLLKDAYAFDDNKEEKNLCFIAHAGATVALVRSIVSSIDERGLASTSQSKDTKIKIRICSLYDLAREYTAVDLRNSTPLDLDAAEGRRLQAELIESVVRDHGAALATIYRTSASEPFLRQLTSKVAADRNRLVAEIMNEFAVLLDAESIRMGDEKAQRYLDGKRQAWSMNLPEKGDREIVLRLHSYYRELLRGMGTISVDQIISDFANYLDRNQWDNLRNRDGFDALFVDELHLFNKVERMTFPNLLRYPTANAKIVPVFMAYDLRQQIRDTVSQDAAEMEIQSGAWIGANFGKSALVELEEIFRFPAEIAQFVEDLGTVLPTAIAFDELNLAKPEAKQVGGMSPTLRNFATNLALYNWVFEAAHRRVRDVGQGRKVAVLCMSDEMFSVYNNAGAHKGEFITIDSRDDLQELRYAGRRFIFSQPDYVAGLQFDIVYLIHIDKNGYMATDGSPLLRQQYIGQVYRGVTRAAQELILCSSEECAGPSPVLSQARARGSLKLLQS